MLACRGAPCHPPSRRVQDTEPRGRAGSCRGAASSQKTPWGRRTHACPRREGTQGSAAGRGRWDGGVAKGPARHREQRRGRRRSPMLPGSGAVRPAKGGGGGGPRRCHDPGPGMGGLAGPGSPETAFYPARKAAGAGDGEARLGAGGDARGGGAASLCRPELSPRALRGGKRTAPPSPAAARPGASSLTGTADPRSGPGGGGVPAPPLPSSTHKAAPPARSLPRVGGGGTGDPKTLPALASAGTGAPTTTSPATCAAPPPWLAAHGSQEGPPRPSRFSHLRSQPGEADLAAGVLRVEGPGADGRSRRPKQAPLPPQPCGAVSNGAGARGGSQNWAGGRALPSTAALIGSFFFFFFNRKGMKW